MSKYDIKNKLSEPERINQNPAKGIIGELWHKWYWNIFKSGCPRRLWCYGMTYLAKVMQQTASHSGNLDGHKPIEKITGETPDIYKYMDFGFYGLII